MYSQGRNSSQRKIIEVLSSPQKEERADLLNNRALPPVPQKPLPPVPAGNASTRRVMQGKKTIPPVPVKPLPPIPVSQRADSKSAAEKKQTSWPPQKTAPLVSPPDAKGRSQSDSALAGPHANPNSLASVPQVPNQKPSLQGSSLPDLYARSDLRLSIFVKEIVIQSHEALLNPSLAPYVSEQDDIHAGKRCAKNFVEKLRSPGLDRSDKEQSCLLGLLTKLFQLTTKQQLDFFAELKKSTVNPEDCKKMTEIFDLNEQKMADLNIKLSTLKKFMDLVKTVADGQSVTLDSLTSQPVPAQRPLPMAQSCRQFQPPSKGHQAATRLEDPHATENNASNEKPDDTKPEKTGWVKCSGKTA